MVDERGAPDDQLTAVEAVTVIRVSDDPEKSKDHESHKLGIDQTGTIRPIAPPEWISRGQLTDRDEFLTRSLRQTS
jgi:hypothetical protein